MSTTEPTPTPDATTVVTDVHEVLDAAKTGALEVVAAVEAFGVGTVVEDVKKAIHDGIELIKQRVSELLHGAQPSVPPVPTQTPPTA